MEKWFRSAKHYDWKCNHHSLWWWSHRCVCSCGESIIRKMFATGWKMLKKNRDSCLMMPFFYWAPSAKRRLCSHPPPQRCERAGSAAEWHSVCCSRTLQQSRCLLSWGSCPDLPVEGHSLIILQLCSRITAPAASAGPHTEPPACRHIQTHYHRLHLGLLVLPHWILERRGP